MGDVDRSTMRDRELLSQEGVVLINLMLDKNNGAYQDLEIISRGFISQDETQVFFDDLRRRIHNLTLSPSKNMQKEIQDLATAFINEETKRRPFIFVSISKV